MATDHTTLPTTASELDSTNSARHGHRRPAGLAEVVAGLRAQVRGELPESKPACPTVVSCRLPRSTKEDTLHREAAAWTAKLRHTRGAQAPAWAQQLAEAELSSWSSWELERNALGHRDDTHRNLDRVVGQDDAGNDLTHHEVVADPALTRLAEQEELRWQLEAAKEQLGLLPERQQQALALVAEGRRPVDVATELGVSRAAVSQLLAKARTNLAKAKEAEPWLERLPAEAREQLLHQRRARRWEAAVEAARLSLRQVQARRRCLLGA